MDFKRFCSIMGRGFGARDLEPYNDRLLGLYRELGGYAVTEADASKYAAAFSTGYSIMASQATRQQHGVADMHGTRDVHDAGRYPNLSLSLSRARAEEFLRGYRAGRAAGATAVARRAGAAFDESIARRCLWPTTNP